jgi:hypothetical protein
MIALSIRQPWAWLITRGDKPIENRKWKTGFRGVFLVHAGKSFDWDGYAWVSIHFPGIPMPPAKGFQFGGIVGHARLVDCLEAGSPEADRSPWFSGPFGFLLADATPLPFTPWPGKLGFFRIPLEIGFSGQPGGGLIETPDHPNRRAAP